MAGTSAHHMECDGYVVLQRRVYSTPADELPKDGKSLLLRRFSRVAGLAGAVDAGLLLGDLPVNFG